MALTPAIPRSSTTTMSEAFRITFKSEHIAFNKNKERPIAAAMLKT